jgi:capsular exopolysaccharide synthesis family protein
MGLEAKVASLKANAEVLKQTVEAAKERERVAAEKMRPYLLARENLEHKRQLWNALTLKAASAAIDKQIGVTTVKVVDKAEPGIKPVRPRTTLNIALGVVLGLALGIGLAFFIEYLDTSVKTIDDVERALQAPVLGVIPQNVGNLLDEGPESPHAEAYRVLRTNFLFSRKKQDGNTITIVSGGAGEGKSTTLFNLAVTFAQNGSRVLMVDSDLRRPSLHKMLRVSNAIGLTDYLLKQNTLAEVIQTTPHPNLDFLPSGKLASSALGILSSQAMRELIDELKRRYDYVFFDSPPIMGVSDASVLARTVDYALQVVQYRRYPQPMTLRAKQMIEKVGGTLAGIVLNNINMSQDSYYYYYSGYFEESHYGKSGSDSTKPKAAGSKKGEPAVEVEIKQKY